MNLDKLYRSKQINFNWFIPSLFFALYFALISLAYAFSQEYRIQDDARIHVVWLQRFLDPDLFPTDFLADYFTYFLPWGFKGIYWLGAKVGIEPLIFAKILPSILGLTTAIYVFYFSLEIIPRQFTAFLSSLMITQLIWTNDDLISATPRAFVYPLFAAFLYYLATEKLFSCLLTMFLLGLFYPQVLLVEISILGLRIIDWQSKFYLTKKLTAYQWFGLGLLVVAIALFPFTQRSPEWATSVTASQMAQIPEFNAQGRTFFYGVGWLQFFLAGDSGLCLPNFPPIIWLGFALPWLLLRSFFSKSLVTMAAITPKLQILGQVIAASLIMYGLAHVMLLKIHLPSRYTYHTLRFVLAIAFAITFTAITELVLNWLARTTQFTLLNQITIVAVTAFLTIALIFPMIPLVSNVWLQNWRSGKETKLYQYLAAQPKDIMVASISEEINLIPAFAQRSILIGSEFAFPYHPPYHQELINRATSLLTAQYASNPAIIKDFINKYHLDYLLIDRNAFTTEYLQQKNWLVYSSWQKTTKKVITKLSFMQIPQEELVLPKLIAPCSVVKTKQSNLVDTTCLLNSLSIPHS